MTLRALLAVAVAGAFAAPSVAQSSPHAGRLLLAGDGSGYNTPIPSAPIGAVSPATGRPGGVDVPARESASAGGTVGAAPRTERNRESARSNPGPRLGYGDEAQRPHRGPNVSGQLPSSDGSG